METSKSGRTFYFRGSAYARATGGGISGGHFDVEIGEEYWISGVNVVKRRVSNRHWAGSGRIQIESVAVEDYLEHIEQDQINPLVQTLVDPFLKTNRERIRYYLNEYFYEDNP